MLDNCGDPVPGDLPVNEVVSDETGNLPPPRLGGDTTLENSQFADILGYVDCTPCGELQGQFNCMAGIQTVTVAGCVVGTNCLYITIWPTETYCIGPGASWEGQISVTPCAGYFDCLQNCQQCP